MQPALSPQALVERLFAELTELKFQAPTGGAPGSAKEQIFLALERVGKEFDVRYPRSKEERAPGRRQPSAYLYDLIWRDSGTARLELVAEVEWQGIDEVKYDFEKLIYAKAPLKLLFCNVRRDERRLVAELSELLLSHPNHINGEEYIVIWFRDAENPLFREFGK